MKKKQFSGNRRMPRRGEKVEEEEEKSPFPVQAAPSGFKGSKFTTKFKVTQHDCHECRELYTHATNVDKMGSSKNKKKKIL